MLPLVRIGFCAVLMGSWLGVAALTSQAQELVPPAAPSESDAPPPADEFSLGPHPLVRLIYYTDEDPVLMGQKLIAVFDLREWTPAKNVYITSRLQALERVPDLPLGSPYPSFETPRRYSNGTIRGNYRTQAGRASNRARYQRVWDVHYEDIEADPDAPDVKPPSRLIIGGRGLQGFTQTIYGHDDAITLIHLPSVGWHELGLESRLERYRQKSRFVPQNPATQNPFGQ